MPDRRSRGPRPATAARPATSESSSSRSRRPRRRRSSNPYAPQAETRLTSLPTHRGAYQETRQWLLEKHGSVCAYCAGKVDPRAITLDHVTPRRGLSAYDRRDNLVLACTPCNASKADKPILAFLLARRERAANLLRYGRHLSPMLLRLAEEVAGPDAAARAARLADPDYPYAD
ncbi:MAG TPA: HNH endonuclease signature motif containing protein [Gemmatimonadales bacterium]